MSTQHSGQPPAMLRRIIGNSLWMVAPFAVLGFAVGLSVNIAVALVLGAVVGAIYWFMWRPGGPNRRKVLRKYGPAAFGLVSEDD
jgi:hypothetical protein